MKVILQDKRTRAAAAIYHGDMYVECDASMKVIARERQVGKCKVYIINEYQLSGLRDNRATFLTELHGMAKGGTLVLPVKTIN